MEKKINIAELLKACPTGMELDCTMYDNLYFDRVDDFDNIRCYFKSENGYLLNATFHKNGCYNTISSAKCVIFPKGKTTWEGFVPPIKFKDGDIVFSGVNLISILKEIKPTENFHCYVSTDMYGKLYIDEGGWTTQNIRLATEEEKAKLFRAIKDNGYKWNNETKVLEKLTESKEDTNDEIVMSGIYFDRENYADEVELHLNNYEIEIRDGKTYAIFKEKLPMFKDGDIVTSLNTSIYIFTNCSSIVDGYFFAPCGLIADRKGENHHFNVGTISISVDNMRLASEEEKQKLFDAIKANGYKWNAETKTLEKLPRFKVGDILRTKKNAPVTLSNIIITKVKSSGYEGVIGDTTNKAYINLKYQDNYELVPVEPMFKVGNRIKNKSNYIATIIKFKDDYYYYKDKNGYGMFHISGQDQWELVSDKFDINTLVPFESRVLVRDVDHNEWEGAVFGRYDGNSFFTIGGVDWRYCIPYEGNEHLFGTTNDCEDYYKTW